MMKPDRSHIELLPAMEAVRRRPHLYIGNTGPTALWELVKIVLDYCVGTTGPIPSDAKHVTIALLANGSFGVVHDGQGLPVDLRVVPVNNGDDRPWATDMLTTLWSSGGFPGDGLAVVNALSSRAVLVTYHESGMYQQLFTNGVPDNPLERVDITVLNGLPKQGTALHFQPNQSIFHEGFDLDYFAARLQEYAAAHPAVEFTLTDFNVERLNEATQRTTEVAISLMGVFASPPEAREAALRFSDPHDIAALRRLLAVEQVIDERCMCSGEYWLEFFGPEGEHLTAVSIHHSTHIRSLVWSGDALLKDGKALMDWFISHGIPDVEALRSDKTRYSVYLTQADQPSPSLLTMIHRELNIGLLKAKHLIRTGNVLYSEDEAAGVYRLRQELDAGGHTYTITPDFPY